MSMGTIWFLGKFWTTVGRKGWRMCNSIWSDIDRNMATGYRLILDREPEITWTLKDRIVVIIINKFLLRQCTFWRRCLHTRRSSWINFLLAWGTVSCILVRRPDLINICWRNWCSLESESVSAGTAERAGNHGRTGPRATHVIVMCVNKFAINDHKRYTWPVLVTWSRFSRRRCKFWHVLGFISRVAGWISIWKSPAGIGSSELDVLRSLPSSVQSLRFPLPIAHLAVRLTSLYVAPYQRSLLVTNQFIRQMRLLIKRGRKSSGPSMNCIHLPRYKDSSIKIS